jgi:hypothetical protein
MTFQLIFGNALYDRAQPLIDGTVRTRGLDWNSLIQYPEIWRRMPNNCDFDALSLSSYLNPGIYDLIEAGQRHTICAQTASLNFTVVQR